MQWLTPKMRARPVRTALGAGMHATAIAVVVLSLTLAREAGPLVGGALSVVCLTLFVAGSFVMPHEPTSLELWWRERNDARDLERLLR